VLKGSPGAEEMMVDPSVDELVEGEMVVGASAGAELEIPRVEDALVGPEIKEPGAVSDDDNDDDAVDADRLTFTPWRPVLSAGP